MADKIDRIGRSHEWLTGYNLDRDEQSKLNADKFMSSLSDSDKKRVFTGALYTATKIKELNYKKHISSVCVLLS
jgi:hypothetical protein